MHFFSLLTKPMSVSSFNILNLLIFEREAKTNEKKTAATTENKQNNNKTKTKREREDFVQQTIFGNLGDCTR